MELKFSRVAYQESFSNPVSEELVVKRQSVFIVTHLIVVTILSQIRVGIYRLEVKVITCNLIIRTFEVRGQKQQYTPHFVLLIAILEGNGLDSQRGIERARYWLAALL